MHGEISPWAGIGNFFGWGDLEWLSIQAQTPRSSATRSGRSLAQVGRQSVVRMAARADPCRLQRWRVTPSLRPPASACRTMRLAAPGPVPAWQRGQCLPCGNQRAPNGQCGHRSAASPRAAFGMPLPHPLTFKLRHQSVGQLDSRPAAPPAVPRSNLSGLSVLSDVVISVPGASPSATVASVI